MDKIWASARDMASCFIVLQGEETHSGRMAVPWEFSAEKEF